MKRLILLAVVLAFVLIPQSVWAEKARSISSDADSAYHAEHLQKHLGETSCHATGNYIKTRSEANKVIGHLEQADAFTLLNVKNGRAQIEVLDSAQTSPDSWVGMTGWVNSDYIDCNCSVEAYYSKQSTPWKAAYRKFVVESDDFEIIKENAVFWLAYINDDDIPELIIDTQFTAGGCYILTYFNGEVDYEIIGSNGISWYIDRNNRLLNSAGQQDNYYDDVYAIIDGKWNCIYHAENYAYPSPNYDNDQRFFKTYYIGDRVVSQKEYEDTLDFYFDMDHAIRFVNGTSAMYLLNVIQ